MLHLHFAKVYMSEVNEWASEIGEIMMTGTQMTILTLSCLHPLPPNGFQIEDN
jgi:hypothetical protein